MKPKLIAAVSLIVFVLSSNSFAQYQVSGSVDVVLRNKAAEDASNKTFKGFSNFDFIRARIFFDAQPSEKVSVFTQVLVNNDKFQLYGAYMRLAKIGGKDVNFQAGIIPTPIGLFGPRAYSDKNPLVGVPLMYLYHTGLAPSGNQVTNDQLFESRGEGYENYGLPIMYDPCWNGGAELFGSVGMVDWSVAALSGAVSAPRTQPEKGLPQLTGKLGFYFSPVFSLTFSGFAGPYLDDVSAFYPEIDGGEYDYTKLNASDAYQEAKGSEDFLNLGGGVGAHYDYGMLEAYAEGFFARWEHPIYENLDAYSAYADARYKLGAQWYLAGRVETITFSDHDFGGLIGTQKWDYPLNRLELGVGYHVDESMQIKAVTQIVRCNDNDALDDEMLAIQLSTIIH